MLGRLGIALSLVGCGRLGFDARTDASSDDGTIDDAVTIDANCTLGAWGPVVEETQLNRATAEDYGGQISPDGLAIVFDSDGPTSHDLYWAERATRTSPWSVPAPITELNDPTFVDADGSLTRDLLEIYFSSGRGGFCVWHATRPSRGAAWNAPVRQTQLCSTPSGGPWVSPDGLRLYYNTRDDAAAAGRVMFTQRSSRSEDFPAGTQVGFGGAAYNRGYVALADAELTMYFEYDGPLHLARATRTAIDQPFGVPVDFTETDSTPGSNGDVSLTEDGQILVWASQRNTGQYDLFSMTKPCL